MWGERQEVFNPLGEQQIDLWIGGPHIMLIIATKAMICEESVRTQEKYI